MPLRPSDTSKTSVVLVLNGSIAKTQLQRELAHSNNFIVCADGAARHVLALRFTPDLVVGDLDSLSTENQQTLTEARVPFLKSSPHKDKTDGELALQAALTRNPERITIFGMDGGRFDMVYVNLSLLLTPELTANSTAVECYFEDESCGVLLTSKTPFSRECKASGTISLLALTDEVEVTELSGTYWLIKNERILRSSARTVSNRVGGSNRFKGCETSSDKTLVRCVIESGRALLVIAKVSEDQ